MDNLTLQDATKLMNDHLDNCFSSLEKAKELALQYGLHFNFNIHYNEYTFYGKLPKWITDEEHYSELEPGWISSSDMC